MIYSSSTSSVLLTLLYKFLSPLSLIYRLYRELKEQYEYLDITKVSFVVDNLLLVPSYISWFINSLSHCVFMSNGTLKNPRTLLRTSAVSYDFSPSLLIQCFDVCAKPILTFYVIYLSETFPTLHSLTKYTKCSVPINSL